MNQRMGSSGVKRDVNFVGAADCSDNANPEFGMLDDVFFLVFFSPGIELGVAQIPAAGENVKRKNFSPAR